MLFHQPVFCKRICRRIGQQELRASRSSWNRFRQPLDMSGNRANGKNEHRNAFSAPIQPLRDTGQNREKTHKSPILCKKPAKFCKISLDLTVGKWYTYWCWCVKHPVV
jgi:hypothetical protein